MMTGFYFGSGSGRSCWWRISCVCLFGMLLFSAGSERVEAQNMVMNVSSVSNSVLQWTKPADDSFTVTLEGSTAAVGYWFVTSNGWFTLSPTTGTSTGETDTITVSYNTENMDVGSYTGEIMLVAPNATNTPVMLPVYLTVTANAGVTTGVRITPATEGVPGMTAVVPIELVSAGNVNAVGGTISYDRRVFRNPEVTWGTGVTTNDLLVSNTTQGSAGKVGFMVSRPNQTSTFAGGVLEVAQVSFLVVASATPVNSEFTFIDSPVVNEVSGVDALTIDSQWPDGTVRLYSGIEADVMPRASNDFAVSVSDWTQVGRFVAGLDRISNKAEFQRADCAPRETYGDGQLSVIDWVQAGRYAAAIDSLLPGNGPYETMNRGSKGTATSNKAWWRTRDIWAEAPLTVESGETFEMRVLLAARGDENAIGFSLAFDPDLFEFVSAASGDDATSAYFLGNDKMAGNGIIGIVMAFPSGNAIAAGTQNVAKVTLKARAVSDVTMGEIAFTDNPVRCELSSRTAFVLPTLFESAKLFTVRTDTKYPYVGITSPESDGYDTSDDTVKVEGFMLSDDDAVAEMAWSNSRGGGGSVDPATFWSVDEIALQPGKNVITVTAISESGVEVGDSITVVSALDAGNVLYDYDGDGIADFAVYDQSTGTWYIRKLDGTVIAWALPWGGPGLEVVPGDFDGDGRADLAVYSEASGTWYIRNLAGSVLAWGESWGGPGFSPVPGDFDGDGKSDMAVFHSASGTWYIRNLAGSVLAWGESWGGPGFVPVSGDFSGEGATDFAVYHQDTGTWYIRSLDGTLLEWATAWGGVGFDPVAGDYDGNGIDDMAVFHSATGCWYIRSLAGEIISWAASWGGPGFMPVSGDVDGDGKADLIVYQEASGMWYARSLAGNILAWGENWGGPGLVPVGGASAVSGQ